MAETYLDSAPRHIATADRFQVVVHVAAEALGKDVPAGTSEADYADAAHRNAGADDSAETPGLADLFNGPDATWSYIDNGPHVPAETSRRLSCDCSIVKLIEDAQGEPLSIGRKSRIVPPPMRRALLVRDRGCQFPGCNHSAWLDAHHVEHWADGGETSLDNLLLLCKFHHRLVHEGGFACERDADGRIRFRDAFGAELSSTPPPLPPVFDPIRWFETKSPDLDIDSKTCVTLWAGERMDYDMAVEGVMQESGSLCGEVASGGP